MAIGPGGGGGGGRMGCIVMLCIYMSNNVMHRIISIFKWFPLFDGHKDISSLEAMCSLTVCCRSDYDY